MKKTCNQYTSEDISRFVDKELPESRYHALARHRVHCPDCNRLVEQYRSLSAAFTHHADQQGLRLDPAKLKQKLDHVPQDSRKASLRNICLKLASITAILMISLFAFQGVLFGPSGPSAIVKSIDTDFASVMIIETQKEKHTIIWFSET